MKPQHILIRTKPLRLQRYFTPCFCLLTVSLEILLIVPKVLCDNFPCHRLDMMNKKMFSYKPGAVDNGGSTDYKMDGRTLNGVRNTYR